MTWKIKLEDAPDGFDDCINISSSKPNWNDFGFNYHASVYFLYKGEMIFLSAYVLPLNIKEQKPYSYLTGAPQGELRYFVSLLSNPEQYRSLASKLSVDAFIYILKELHEVSHDRFVGTGKYEHVIQIEPFRLGVLRDQKAYLSLINGFASAYVQPPIGDAKTPFTFSTLLPGTENFVSLDISFRHHEHFDDRVHCLIGVNGTGKTNLLARLAVEAASLSNRKQDGPPTQLYSENKTPVQYDGSTLDFAEDFRFNRVVSYFSDPSSALPRFSSVGAFEYHAFNTTAKKETKEFHQNLSYLLVTLLRVTDDRFNQAKSKIFTEALSGIMPMDLLAIPVSEDCPEYCCVADSEGKNGAL